MSNVPPDTDEDLLLDELAETDPQRAWQIHTLELENYWRLITLGAESAAKLYGLLATSLVLINGGALTAIVSIVTPTIVTEAIAGGARLPLSVTIIACLFAGSLGCTLAGIAFGRLADDAGIRMYKRKAKRYPFRVYLDERTSTQHSICNATAYILTVLALLLHLAALTTLCVKLVL